MNHINKYIGNPKIFESETVLKVQKENNINSIANLEKAIFTLEYLGQLKEAGLDFIFKGGTAVQISIGDYWSRLSVDVDICTNSTEAELIEILNRIYEKFDQKAFRHEPRKGFETGIPFYLFKIKTPPITDIERTILLDVLGIKPKYFTTKTQLKAFFFDSLLEVTTPTISSLLGDKLSTIGPTTVGRVLNNSRNGLEYVKHFYDIYSLQKSAKNIRECFETYNECLEVQSKIRQKKFLMDDCFYDALYTCQIASLPQTLGEEIINGMAPNKKRAINEFTILQDGLRRFRPFIIKDMSYTWDQLREYASLTALLIKMIKDELTNEQVNDIFKNPIPKVREEIIHIVGKIRSIPIENRWFINLEEIMNFPSILNHWNNFFFLEDLL